ncbi:pyridoxamine 5'-phosphate oxidase family protein [Haloarcula salinisoli]|uniref:Pyridoxamine 5'-phosphate oxidase family protein n=1 Tax=Haloarcula salinisoli TaxID=2487746 RepID=A0A8J7YM43_9EURY|nr:pyridoxamine 5'-phosphate oxidase family protein [Halomicroarcula salinisoli]MBX0288340.1 pyridoxamine 5'-phosphate oxidase family protein [Halomicroarcula salinisoli]MBX0305821.1 pyridoxamine 5'-phosphate oxidase family protein [Halomicroarcula salinisoli]
MSETSVAMGDEERDEFLGRGGTGVLSLSTDGGPPHTVPVSYGYDSAEATFYFRLAVGQSHSKGSLPDRAVSFVTFDRTDDHWHSVVAEGHLEDVEREGIGTETLEGLHRVEIPLIGIFDHPTREVDFQFYRLVPDELTGRVQS